MRRRRPEALLLLPLLLAASGVAGAQSSDWYLEPPFVSHRGRIGVQVQPMTPELREHFEAPPDRGLLVTRVEPGGPAARADLRVGDVIASAAGKPMRRPFDLVKVVGRAAPGETLELEIVRNGKQRTVTVEPQGEPMPWVDPDHWSEWLERSLRKGSAELRRRLEEIERRLEELEQKLEDGSTLREHDGRKT